MPIIMVYNIAGPPIKAQPKISNILRQPSGNKATPQWDKAFQKTAINKATIILIQRTGRRIILVFLSVILCP
jgi:hypothetical protein